MLKQIKAGLEQIALANKEKERIMIQSFNNPIAEQTDWTPIRGGGSNFKSQELRLTEFNQLKVVKSLGGKFFFGLFALVGFAILIAAAGGAGGFFTGSDFNEPLPLVFMTVFGLVFFLVGAGSLLASKNLVFDKMQGYCWEGSKSPRNVIRAEETAKLIKLDRVKALQIVKEHIRSSKNSYYSFELNLILDDGSRVNVMDHGSLKAIRKDAGMLGEYLGIPIFDAG